MTNNIGGITTTEETLSHEIKVTRVQVTTDEAAAVLDKPIGNYITVEFPQDYDTDEFYTNLTGAVFGELRELMKLKPTEIPFDTFLNFDITRAKRVATETSA